MEPSRPLIQRDWCPSEKGESGHRHTHKENVCEEYSTTCQGTQTVKNLPAMQKTQLRSLGQEDPLEKGMATHSRILTWRIPWTEEPGGLQSMGLQTVRHDWAINVHTRGKREVQNRSYPHAFEATWPWSTSWSQTSCLQNCETINSCCLSHLKMLVTQSHLTLCEHMGCSPPGSSCKTQNSGLRPKEEKPRDPINQPSRCNTQEGLLSVAQTGDSDLLGGRAPWTANWASFL